MDPRKASHISRAAVAGFALLLAASGVALGHTPTDTGSRGSFSSDQLVYYKFAGSYASWITLPFTEEFETYYPSTSTNNSLSPRLDYSSSGSAIAYYYNSTTSPCTGSTEWLGCAPGAYSGTSNFRVYVRNLESAPHPNDWGWYENGLSCAGDSVCFYMKRTIVHELGHAILSLGHDGQGESNTVMGTVQPWASNLGWNRREWLRCDQARTQLLWGARNVAGPIAGCFDDISGAGSNGLNTVVSLTANDTYVCLNQSVTLSGSLTIASNTNYDRLSGDPLGSRVVTIKRDGVTWATRTTGSPTGAYSASAGFSTAGSRGYVSSFPNEGTDALTGDTSPTVVVTWSAAC